MEISVEMVDFWCSFCRSSRIFFLRLIFDEYSGPRFVLSTDPYKDGTSRGLPLARGSLRTGSSGPCQDEWLCGLLSVINLSSLCDRWSWCLSGMASRLILPCKGPGVVRTGLLGLFSSFHVIIWILAYSLDAILCFQRVAYRNGVHHWFSFSKKFFSPCLETGNVIV